MKNEILKLVEDFIRNHGESNLINVLSPGGGDNVLTIVSNAGVHPYHALHKRGEVYVASEGSLDFSSKESAVAEIESVLLRVAKKLKEKRWNRVYLVPFGPAPLSLQIKSLVNKILDIETIDVLHIGNGTGACMCCCAGKGGASIASALTGCITLPA
jgi:hypothetical protein